MPNWRQVGTSWAYVQLELSTKVVAVCFQALAVSFLAELEGVLYADHVRFHSSLHRASIPTL